MSIEPQVVAACRQHTDDRALRPAVLEVLRPEVPFDAHAWLLTDPVTMVGSAPHATVPSLEALPSAIRLKYLCPRNRWTSLPTGAVASLTSAPPSGPGDRRWREFLSGYGIADVASAAFHDEQGCWGFLDLWRREAPFTAQELARRLKVRHQTAAADAYLRVLLPTEDDRRPVPAAAYNVAAQLLAVEAEVDAHPPVCRVRLHSGLLVTLRAARLEQEHGSADLADIAVTIERCSSSDRLELFCRVHELSARETEVLNCLADGGDTRTVAARLFLSEYTVQDHLKSVLAKTGVRNRRTLLTRAAG